MRVLIGIFVFFAWVSGHADTIQSYLKISNNIPGLELKADSRSQALARSARNVLIITNESIAETMLEANRLASQQGKPLFCLPAEVQLNAKTLDAIIKQNANQQLSSLPKDRRTSISEIAWQGVMKAFPCNASHEHRKRMAQVSAILNR